MNTLSILTSWMGEWVSESTTVSPVSPNLILSEKMRFSGHSKRWALFVCGRFRAVTLTRETGRQFLS